jgi:hypothetical protein
MNNIGKNFTVILIVIIAFSSLMMTKPANAQGISAPSFTVKIIDGSYVAPTTYSTDPYTGATITHGGDTINSRNFTFTIQNVPKATYYLIENKGHYAAAWSPIYTWGLNVTLPASSGSKTIFTIVSTNLIVTDYTPNTSSDNWGNYAFTLASGSQIDFRMQTVAGNQQNDPLYGYSANHPIIVGNASPWSNTQTITIPTSSTSINPTQPPTNTSRSTPTVSELPWLAILPLFVALLFIAVKLRRRRR